MVIPHSTQRGSLITDIMVAIAIFSLALFPVGYSYVHEQDELRIACQRAVVMEEIDGDFELLRAGEWKRFKAGSQPFAITATNLPPGHASLELTGKHLKLTWSPNKKAWGHPLVRETDLP